MKSFHIQPVDESYAVQITQFLIIHWGSVHVVSRGCLYDATALPGFMALRGDHLVGLATYRLDGDACELVTIDSEIEGQGVGSALITAVKETAIAANCDRLWLITTNDNLAALGFYQKRGFRITAVHPNALDISRQLKPQIPFMGLHGIPLRDEIELEMRVD